MYKRISGCGSGTEYMAVTPWGDLYPCHQFVGDAAYKLGQRVGRRDQHRPARRVQAVQRLRPARLQGLLGRLYCAGGCAANALHATGDIHGVYEYGCKVFRKRIECALMIKVAESLDPDLAPAHADLAPGRRLRRLRRPANKRCTAAGRE